MEKGRAVDGAGSARSGRPTRPKSADKTLYSQLSDDEKTKFRAWANMATARRISDARVNELDRRRPPVHSASSPHLAPLIGQPGGQ